MKRILSFFSGFLTGGLVGAGLVLLLTPYSGETLRSNLESRYIEIRNEVQNAAEARRMELERQLEALRKPAAPSD